MFIAALNTVTKTRKKPQRLTTDEWIKNMTHTQNGILLSNKKNEILPSAETWVGLEGITPSEMSDRDKYYMTALNM